VRGTVYRPTPTRLFGINRAGIDWACVGLLHQNYTSLKDFAIACERAAQFETFELFAALSARPVISAAIDASHFRSVHDVYLTSFEDFQITMQQDARTC